MSSPLREYLWVAAGSLLIAAGSTLAGLSAFDDQVRMVMVGFLLFIVGYRLSQNGLYSDGTLSVTKPRLDRRGLSRICLLTLGWAGIAFGVTMFSQTVLEPSISNAVVSGVASIGGYMAAHVGLNGVGVGDSIFGPVVNLSSNPAGRDR